MFPVIIQTFFKGNLELLLNSHYVARCKWNLTTNAHMLL